MNDEEVERQRLYYQRLREQQYREAQLRAQQVGVVGQERYSQVQQTSNQYNSQTNIQNQSNKQQSNQQYNQSNYRGQQNSQQYRQQYGQQSNQQYGQRNQYAQRFGQQTSQQVGQQQNNQYGQNYGQQNYVQQGYNNQTSEYSHGHKKIFAVVGILVALFIGVGIFFMLPTEEQEFNTDYETSNLIPSVPLTADEFRINNLKFASVVYQDYSYVEQIDKTFNIEDPIYIYFEPRGFEYQETNNGYKFHIVQDLEVWNPDGEKISYLDVKGIVELKDLDYLKLSIHNSMLLEYEEKPGAYTVKITLHDKMSGKSVVAEDYFILEV